MSDNKKQFQIHLPGLLKVLAENLYSSPKVAIRELLQNAHDSCVRREVEQKEAHYKARVDVSIDDEARTITIQDNGSGLTKQEVGDYLSTIGRSYTRQLGENLSILSPEEAEKLIGQFGLGFLSAFLISSDITLTTRSVTEDNPTLQWRSEGDIHYEVEEVEEGSVGTKVTLAIKPAAAYLLNDHVLTETIQQYADFLPVPVYVEGSSVAVNTMSLPWESLDSTLAIRDYISRKFSVSHPLYVLELHDHIVPLGHDEVLIPLSGFLFIPPGSIASVQEYGDLTIYIRRMFISENHRDLLPAWARFVRGVVDCPQLQPTASRENIRREETFNLVQKALEEQLTEGLRQLAQNDPTIWKQIIRGHRDVILGWAVKNDNFFERIAEIITFRTTRGQMPLPDYLELTGGTAYYVTHAMESKQEQILGEGFGMPVIDASRFSEPAFLRKYAQLRRDMKLVPVDDDSNQMLHPVAEEAFAALIAYYRAKDMRVQVANFKPEVLPAVMVYPKDAEFIRDTREALDSGEIPGPFAGLVGSYLSNMPLNDGALSGTLYLNAASELVQTLAKLEQSSTRDAALDLISQMARLFAGRMLDAPQVIDLFGQTNSAIETLIDVGTSK